MNIYFLNFSWHLILIRPKKLMQKNQAWDLGFRIEIFRTITFLFHNKSNVNYVWCALKKYHVSCMYLRVKLVKINETTWWEESGDGTNWSAEYHTSFEGKEARVMWTWGQMPVHCNGGASVPMKHGWPSRQTVSLDKQSLMRKKDGSF